MTQIRRQRLATLVVGLMMCSFANGQLTLNVDVGTGATQLTNLGNSAVTFDGYSISSPAGHLNGTWNSLEKQGIGTWDAADNSSNSRATELNPSGTSELGPGESIDIGSPYDPATSPTMLGERLEDLSFVYTQPGSSSELGAVNYRGPINDVVLTIDPSTGGATLQNRSSMFNVAIDGYTITSTSGSLSPETWNSLDDQGVATWDEADNSDSFRLTELNPLGESQLDAAGATFDLGTILDVGSGVDLDDLEFQYLVTEGGTETGTISLGVAAEPTCNVPDGVISGDFDRDGTVAFLDFLLLANNFGMEVNRYEDGDADCDGTVAFLDFLALANNFGMTAGPSPAAVPEPAAGTLFGIATLGLFLLRKQRKIRERMQ